MLLIDEIIIDPCCGCEISALKKEMKELSFKYKCDVKAKFNGDIIHCKCIRKEKGNYKIILT